MKDLLKYLHRLAGIFRNEDGGFRSQSHDGIFELEFSAFGPLKPRGDHHEGSGNHGHDHHGPSAEVKLNELLFGESCLVERVGEKHRNLSFGAYQPDHLQLDPTGFLALPGCEPLEGVVARGDADVVFVPTGAKESVDGRESAFGWTAGKKVSFVIVLNP
ncbi:MAG: hypothetical protein WHS86_09925 [Desulfosoma sp.]